MCRSPKLPVFSRFRIKILHAFLKLPMHSTCPSITSALYKHRSNSTLYESPHCAIQSNLPPNNEGKTTV